MTKTFSSLPRDDSAQSAVEYALVTALVSLAAIPSLGCLGDRANNTLTDAANSLP